MADPLPEGYREKVIRKIKEEPIVPLGAIATTVALTVAMVKMRRGDSRGLNNWLRIRVVTQGLTVVALCAGTATFWGHKPPTTAEMAAKAEARHAAGRADFEERMRAAEEAETAEAAFRPPPSPPPAQEKIVLKRKTYADKVASAGPVERAASSAEASTTTDSETPPSTKGSWWNPFGRPGSGGSK